MYSFIYSPRPHTSAYEIESSLLVDAEVAKDRLARLQNLHKEILAKKSQCEIGKILEVLVENHHAQEGWSEGRSDHNRLIRIVDFVGEIGQMVRVRITKAHGGALSGEVV